MPNYRRPRRSRSESDPEYRHRPSSPDDEGRAPNAAGDDPLLDDDDLDAAFLGDLADDDFADEDLEDEFDEFDDELDDDEGGGRLAGLPAELGDAYEIVDLLAGALDELPDDFEDEDTVTWEGRARRVPGSLDALLQTLTQGGTLPPLAQLYGFSDLSIPDAARVRQSWDLIAPERRRTLVAQLVMVAENDLDLHLGPFLRIAMADQDAAVRSSAVRGLWEDGQADLIGPLVQMLQNDPDDEARAAAATALGSYVLAGELEEMDVALAMRAEEALLAVLHDDTAPIAVRRRALESIAYSGEAGVRDLIEDAYYSPYEDMRISALFAMGRSADVRWRPLAHAELQNPTAAVRAEAALACGELEAQTALEDLMALLQDDDDDVRLAAIFALGRIGGRDARDALGTVLLSGVPEEVEAAEQALEEMQFYADNDVIPLYDEALEDEDDWDDSPGDGSSDWDGRDLGTYE